MQRIILKSNQDTFHFHLYYLVEFTTDDSRFHWMKQKKNRFAGTPITTERKDNVFITSHPLVAHNFGLYCFIDIKATFSWWPTPSCNLGTEILWLAYMFLHISYIISSTS